MRWWSMQCLNSRWIFESEWLQSCDGQRLHMPWVHRALKSRPLSWMELEMIQIMFSPSRATAKPSAGSMCWTLGPRTALWIGEWEAGELIVAGIASWARLQRFPGYSSQLGEAPGEGWSAPRLKWSHRRRQGWVWRCSRHHHILYYWCPCFRKAVSLPHQTLQN